MILVPLQTFGLGDCLYCQTLVKKLAKSGDKILWPVESHFAEGLNRAYPDVTFIDKRHVNFNFDRMEDFVDGECRILPIRWADQILRVPYTQCMSSKYTLYNLDWMDWREQAGWVHDIKKQKELSKLLGLNFGGEYTLVNKFFGSNSQYSADIHPIDGLFQVEMRTIPGFSLFDWSHIIANATNIHTVSTSIIYILEMLNIEAKEVHLYVRKPIETDFRNIDYLLQRHKYIYHL